ncbi:MAG: histidine--tRNA ligase [Candidatus Proteinoplasmatales archaeon SG8-5]|nr:MAG: histidine--tRNA ligase [Candidatus Proteinoplasmatales archaeon SG8-5]
MTKFQRPRGTRDFPPEQMQKWRYVEGVLRDVAEKFGFGEVVTPTFESTELFIERSGEAIVDEMYAFKDKGGRDIALRPELTAPVMRYYVNELSSRPKPLKLYYFGNVFRYERPQSGRFREFYQFGAELIGAPSMDSDAEIIALALACLKSVGLENIVVRVGHLGILDTVLEELGVPGDLNDACRRFIDKKDPEGLETLLSEYGIDYDNLEKLIEIINTTGGRSAITKVQEMVDEVDENFIYLSNLLKKLSRYGFDNCVVDFGVARGLDYYTGMVFEIDSPTLGAEKQICGGGAYKLAELFGGDEVNSTGFAFGFDRLMLAMENEGCEVPSQQLKAYVIPLSQATRSTALEILKALRENGISADTDLMGRKISKALAYADSVKAKRAILVGEKELVEDSVTVRDMRSGEQTLVRIKDLPAELTDDD